MNWKNALLPLIPGACLIPCNDNKRPIEAKWQKTGYTVEQVLALGDVVKAVGVNTGKTDWVCIDIDGPVGLKTVQDAGLPLPETWTIYRENAPDRMKRIYRVDKTKMPQDKGKWKKGELEVFWYSQQFVACGIHPSGAYYQWDGSPAEIAELPQEWVDFLPRRAPAPALEQLIEVDLQSLLTKEHSMMVDSGLGGEGGRNDALFALAADAYAIEEEARRRAIGNIRVIGTADDLISEALRRTDLTGFPQSEIETCLSSARGNQLTQGFESKWAYQISRKHEVVVREERKKAVAKTCKWTSTAQLLPPGWAGKNGDAKTKLDTGSAGALFEHFLGDRLTYNLMGYEVEIDGQQLSNIERIRFLGAVQNMGYNITDETLCNALMAAALPNSFHPVKQYLEGLDCEPIDTLSLASELLGVDDMLSNVMLQRFLVGAVNRIMEPGCKMDYSCVLHGNQGVGKSEFWKHLFGRDFYQSFNSDVEGKDKYLALHASWGIEVAEFDNMTARSSASLKNFITTASDLLRPPYGRRVELLHRPSVFAGTCNTDDFLRDSTGERRYWVISVQNRIDRDRVKRLRDRVWFSLFQDYRNGVRPYLPHEIETESAQRNQEFEQTSPLRDACWEEVRQGSLKYISKTALRERLLGRGLVPLGTLDAHIKRSMSSLGYRVLRPWGKYGVRLSGYWIYIGDDNGASSSEILYRSINP